MGSSLLYRMQRHPYKGKHDGNAGIQRLCKVCPKAHLTYTAFSLPRLRLESIVEQKAIEANPRFRSCLSARCDHGQIHTNIHDNCVTCEACGAKSCFIHGVPWHKGYTCDAYDATHPDAVSLMTSEERIERTAKRCPGKGCTYYIEKNGGCDHMTCPNCKEGWDWVSARPDRERYEHGLFENLIPIRDY